MASESIAAYSGDAPYFFVSYAHDEAKLIQTEMAWIFDAGFNLWYDDGIHVGAVWRQALADALSGAAGLIFFATARSVESTNCMKELNFALDDDKPIFVVQLDDTSLPGMVRLSLSDRQMLAKGAADESAYRDRLIAALGTVVEPVLRHAEPSAAESDVIETRIPTIAQQPLALDTDDVAFWAESFADDLVAFLNQRWFRVSPTARVDRDAAAVARDLDCDYVLSGNVRAGAAVALRVNLKLMSANGTLLWSGRFDVADRTLEVNDRVVKAAAMSVSEGVIDAEQKAARAASMDTLDAWGLCMRVSRTMINTKENRDERLSTLRLAIERDPDFGFAHATLAGSMSLCVATMFLPNDDAVRSEILFHSERSLALARQDPYVMETASGVQMQFGSPELALQLADRAVAAGGSSRLLGSNTGPGHRHRCMILLGKLDEVLADDQEILPRNRYTVHVIRGELEEALEWARKSVATNPDVYLVWVELANALALLDRNEEAREALANARRLVPTFKVDLFERGSQINWRDDPAIWKPQLAGLRKLGVD